MAEEKKQSEKIQSYAFILPGQDGDCTRFVVLIDPDGKRIAETIFEIGQKSYQENSHKFDILLCNFWTKVLNNDDLLTEEQMNELIKTFGDKFWEMKWIVYRLKNLPCEEFPNVFSSADWF